jgi:monofunctional biosynthetic peptidoglycan transglycosylase
LRRVLRRVLRWFLVAVAAFYGFAFASLAALRWLNPPTTAVQVQRRVESWFHKTKYRKQYSPVPLARISPDLQHAVIAAEDSRFYQHHGFDWTEIKDAIQDEMEDGRLRGASTIEQQLIKNLLLTTWRSPIRKALEATLVWPAEYILGKQRILELYLNVVEWGPGVYGAEAASRYHYRVSAAQVSRDEAARLAALLPAPRRRRPSRMDRYSAVILDRMRKMNW